jgi:hypothetical protein
VTEAISQTLREQLSLSAPYKENEVFRDARVLSEFKYETGLRGRRDGSGI